MTEALQSDPKYLVALTELLCSQVFHSESLQQLSDAFYLVVYGWLVKAYRFFKSHGLAEEVDQVQSLALQVLANPAILNVLWLDIDTHSSIEKVGKVIEIFEPYLKEPAKDAGKFLALCLVLAGKRHEKRGATILEMLQKTEVHPERGRGHDNPSNLLAELIGYLSSQLIPMEQ